MKLKLFIFALFAIISLVAYQKYSEYSALKSINSYDSCITANGSTIQESYPATCVTKLGSTFTQNINIEDNISTGKNFTLKTLLDKSNAIPLTFDNNVYYLVQKKINYDVSNWVALPSKNFDSRVTQISNLYEDPDWGSYKWFDEASSKYIFLEPSGQKEISIKDLSDLRLILKGKTETFQESVATIVRKCEMNEISIGSIIGKSISCVDTTYMTAENNKIVDESSTVNCYLPISSNKYLSFEQTSMPISSSYDMCEELVTLGYIDLGM